MNMPERGWTKSKTFKCDGDLVLHREGRGGGGESGRSTRTPESENVSMRHACPWDSYALCSNDETSHISAGTNSDATKPGC